MIQGSRDTGDETRSGRSHPGSDGGSGDKASTRHVLRPSGPLLSARSLRALPGAWAELWKRRYVQLVLYGTYADLQKEVQRSHVGYLWWLVDPVVNMAVYYVVFAVFLDRGRPDYAPFLLIGLVAWRWLHTTVRMGASAVYSSSGLMRQVFVPKILLPTTAVCKFTVKFLFTLIVLLVFLWLYGFPPQWAYLSLPLLLATELLLILGLSLILAALVPFVPDLRLVIDNGLTLLFFLSGIFYAGSSLPERLQAVFFMNPAAFLVDGYRQVLMEGQVPDLGHLAILALLSLLAVAIGGSLLLHWDRLYPRVVR